MRIMNKDKSVDEAVRGVRGLRTVGTGWVVEGIFAFTIVSAFPPTPKV